MSVGDRIAKKREELGLSQTDLAKKAGLKPPTISHYESGARSPSYEALIKLSNALNVTTDFLITGKEINGEAITDPISKIMLRILQWLPEVKKEKLLEYAIYLSNSFYSFELPIFNEPVGYADFILKKYTDYTLPIDVYNLAKALGIKIFEDNISTEGEGILLKGIQKVIILDSGVQNKQRKKFTVAMLLGHAVIPWHIKSHYRVRKKDSSTLLTEDMQQVEAQRFTEALIMPRIYLERDFIKTRASLECLKKLAIEKYDVSLFALLNCLVQHAKSKYAVVQSENWKVIKTFQGARPLKNQIHPSCIAATFFERPAEQEETRVGDVPANFWLEDGKPNEFVYEESIYNPMYGKVLTLLNMDYTKS
jgi:transcriptional regulator with XRE-family HTH domain